MGGIGKISTTVEKSRNTLGAMAGVAEKTYEHATAIIDKTSEPIIQAVRKNELSVHQVKLLARTNHTDIASMITTLVREALKTIDSQIQH